MEKKLAAAEAKLGDAGAPKSEFLLTQDDWKELAKEGEVRMRVPCAGSRGDFSVSPDNLNKDGLAPQDAPIVQAALQASHARTWAIIKPLCSQALGNADVEKIGQQACVSILTQLDEQTNNQAYEEAVPLRRRDRGRPAPGAGPRRQHHVHRARLPRSRQRDEEHPGGAHAVPRS